MTVEVRDLIKRQGDRFRLEVPDLRVGSGEAFGLVGNNGAGKTTLMRLMLDLAQPDRGVVRIGGENVARSTDWKRHTGSFLDPSFLLDFLTPDEFFDFVGSTYGLSKAEIRERLEPYRLFFTDPIFGRNKKYIRDLSLGNAKKVGIVAALLVQPGLLVLDEPFANLDPGSQIRLKALLRGINETHGTTLFISSHDLVHVTEVCDRIAILDDGQIVRDMRTSPATLRELERYFRERA
ncbi:MAG TPA: ABC transporter ATP-binding protein [Rhodothermales bacterium]|nr:ABC transporter ATP-binding protein [Rhodothermales bacterium]